MKLTFLLTYFGNSKEKYSPLSFDQLTKISPLKTIRYVTC